MKSDIMIRDQLQSVSLYLTHFTALSNIYDHYRFTRNRAITVVRLCFETEYFNRLNKQKWRLNRKISMHLIWLFVAIVGEIDEYKDIGINFLNYPH